MNEYFIIHPEFVNPAVFLAKEHAWQITDGHVFSIDNMTDKELCEAIIDDVLSVTMWEKELGKKMHFGITQLLRFIPKCKQKRVKKALKHDDISGLIQIDRIYRGNTLTGSEIRIKDHPVILKAAMDYCGVWYGDEEIPEGELVIDCGALARKVHELGGIENTVESLTMDMVANIKDVSKNLN